MIKVSELFNVYSWSKLDFWKQQLDENWINFVSRNSNNNWIVGKVVLDESMKVFKKWDISVPLWWAFLLSAFVQQEDFVTAQNVAVLRSKNNMSEIEKWFYCYALRLNRPKFVAFGREVNKYINDIELPDEIPEWVYNANMSEIITKNNPWKNELKTDNWKNFKITSLFTIERGNITSLNDIEEWDIPIVSASWENEWISFYSNIEPKYSNKITVSMNWVNTWFTSYHWYGFNINVDACVLNEKFEMNKYIWIFLATIINNLRYRYSYWRKMSAERLQQETIKLPVDNNWDPDRDFMENYIKNLPYWDRI